MSFTTRNLDMSDAYEKALSYELNSPDALVLATSDYPSSANSTRQRAYVLVVPQSDDPLLVGATVWSGYQDKPYLSVKELGPISVMTRRRLPGDLQDPLELDRPSGLSFAEAAGGEHVSSLWDSGLGGDAVCLARSVTHGADDPVTLSFVAQWMEDGQFISEVLASSSATELRQIIEHEFEVTMRQE
ncbi:hypothetical protein G6L37_05230 [Agrobacterium rubi]|nr:hypothetical protein [Agrobacterium rubi]NTF24759.1 hypothetical protein [Agrobacterium rubi]